MTDYQNVSLTAHSAEKLFHDAQDPFSKTNDSRKG